MSNNSPTVSIKVLHLPVQTDEQGKPAYLDLAMLSKNLRDDVLPITQDDGHGEHGTIPTPKQIFKQASRYVLHQPNALRELSTVFFYHLTSQKDRQTQKTYQPQSDRQKFLDEFGKALGLDDDFFKTLDDIENKNTDNKTTDGKTDNKTESQSTDKTTDSKDKTKHSLNSPDSHTSTAPIFLTGKTGSGKTHIIKQLCKMFDVNFLAVNAPSISNAGYKGMTLADIGASLLQASNKNIAKAEHSVIFFDEFDKLFINDGLMLGAYHLSLVTEILTIIEGTTPFPVKDSDNGGIDSSRMLFVLGGSFNIHQRNERAPIGFMNAKTQQGTPDHQLRLTNFGLPDELAGRIGTIITLDDISQEQMIDILKNSPTSPFVAFKNKLAMISCTASISDAVLSDMADKHHDAIEKFGVRGLYQAFYRLPQISDILHEAPDHPHSHYHITPTGFDRTDHPKVELEVTVAPPPPKPSPFDLYDDMPF